MLKEVSVFKNKFTTNKKSAENLFVTSHRCDATGRYVVRLPLKATPSILPEKTRQMALGSLYHMHRRLNRDSALTKYYREVTETYEELDHVEQVLLNDRFAPTAWYLPYYTKSIVSMIFVTRFPAAI
jgi:hypothetical protein